jgi:hypothetical protein
MMVPENGTENGTDGLNRNVRALASDFVELVLSEAVLSETVLSETVLVLDWLFEPRRCRSLIEAVRGYLRANGPDCQS